MTQAAFRTRFEDLLTRETAQAQALLDALHQEREALHTEPDQVSALARTKQQQIERLEQLHQECTSLLVSCGYTPDPDGMENCLGQCDPGGNLNRRWSDLLDLIRACQQQNELNGAIVAASHQQVRQLLAILHGQAPGAGTYDPSGHPSGPGLSRTLAEA